MSPKHHNGWMQKLKSRKLTLPMKDNQKWLMIRDYWSNQQTTKIIDLLKEYKDVFARDYKYLKGLVEERNEN